mmetsp:Transcript_25615/g.67130  ORF Transcript_25615/g.67130 Transcript_25615/m.67130 type:complete len:524 (+) Transcript_25615:973-2544(+)|eukprot:CAMPEP_0206285360 /NCGR_PEP_ID=MMETSP0106_2-20121207/59_1 /ASSEMBLY_ACC=CAM_ASM_000206 /TAXON_ID=81532 /ORGANISM="Acanthoeca-like sp., Strain 10tr" /LENGTH=523 /DNA_ID=CAMNT_0053715877 /DNA_START=1213 /DNA_END=2784 /DNA_ORIENTATION=-
MKDWFKGVELLVAVYKADLSVTNNNGKIPQQCGGEKCTTYRVFPELSTTTLMTAIDESNSHLIECCLKSGLTLNFHDPMDGSTPLHHAAAKTFDVDSSSYDDTRIVELLLRNGADPHEIDDRENTPVFNAAMGGCPEKLKALIVAGAEVNKLNQDGQSPLMSATFSPDGCVDTLLSANAKVNLISNNGRSALHFACLSGMLKHVQTLIKAGARITLTRTLDSPLHLAAEWGHVDVVGFLVSLGCDPSFKNQDGKVALHVAPKARQMELQVAIDRALKTQTTKNCITCRYEKAGSLVCTKKVKGTSSGLCEVHLCPQCMANMKSSKERLCPTCGKLGGQACVLPEPFKALNTQTFPKECEWPTVIMSYATNSLQEEWGNGGYGKLVLLALVNELKLHGITTFNGYQVSGGKNWQAEFFGVLPESKVVVAMISKRYWRSTACIAELKAALLHKKPVIPLYLEEAPRKGHFLGESVEQIKDANLINTFMDRNCVPPLDQGFFMGKNASDFAKNARLLADVIKSEFL